ncbi:hypothetical protein BKA82DRAFT_4345750 [Pisolithus tinctorius]|nr:hypothetical protein BKA82DRAFT_4345750 [Pisolithus tinctorius]
MAKGSTQKGMRMIGPTPGHRVKQLEVKTRRTGGRYRSRLVEVAIKQPDPATPVHSPRSSPSKHSRSRSHKYFDAWADSAFDGHESMSPPVQQLMLLRKKTQNDYICEWVPRKGEFLKILLELEAFPEPRNCTWCGNDGVYRCPDCLHQPLFCTECCRKSHESLPFHRIQQWTGDFYEESTLHMTGVWLHLGHGGAPCPHAIAPAQQAAGEPLPMDDQEWEDVEDIEENPKHLRPPAGSRYLTVVDVTGVHFIVVNWCECETAEARYIQLLRAKLFPSTFEKPSTAFTFAVLDDFLRDNLECGMSSMNYYSKLRRITSSVFPHLVPDRYHELLWVAWKWRYLKLLKWNGFRGTTRSAEKGGLALFCAACPQPGINVDTNEDLDHWRFTCTVVMDGNFKAEHMHERKSKDQVRLMDGLGYMVTNPNYADYLKATPHIVEKSTCNNHRAISQANAAWGKLHATGIGATACTWHGCFYPHCVVDFQKGERQLNMDYSLANALGYNMEGIKQVVCFYNINCSYMTNLRKRVGRSELIDILSSLRIIPGIGIWHVHGHKKECYARYAPLFIKGAGWVDGEIIETLWSVLNVASTSARGMTSPHCQELLDFQMNDSNFMKMIQIVDSLSQKLKAARAAAPLARQAYIKLDEALTAEQRDSWRTQEIRALQDRVTDPSAMDIFEVQLRAAPTVCAIELTLLEEPRPSGSLHGAASWLARGLRLEEAITSLHMDRKDVGEWASELKKLAMARHADRISSEQSGFIADAAIYLKLHLEVGSNTSASKSVQPTAFLDANSEQDYALDDGWLDDVGDELPASDGTLAGPQDKLPLPSTLGIDACQANDALHGLHLTLADKAAVFQGVVRTAKSYSMKTRAWDMIRAVNVSVKKQATIYNRCRDAMVALGAGADILGSYQELHKEDLAVQTAAFSQNAQEHRGTHLPWFWSINVLQDTESKSWMSEFYHIHWLRAKSVKDRWEEEEELVISEFQWAISFFRFRAKEWHKIQMGNSAIGAPGVRCYAARQRMMYSRLAEHAERKWQAMNATDIHFHPPPLHSAL